MSPRRGIFYFLTYAKDDHLVDENRDEDIRPQGLRKLLSVVLGEVEDAS